MIDWSGPDTWVVILDETGTAWFVMPEGKDSIDAAVERYISSGRTLDTLLDLTDLDGSELRILASTVRLFYTCTPESRMNHMHYQAFREREKQQFRADLGLWGESGDEQ